jgi:hypothetical protein
MDIDRKLKELGAAWAVTRSKTVLPEDGYDAKPSYHIHPDASSPRQEQIKRFPSLLAVRSWIEASFAAREMGEGWVVETSPDGRTSWIKKG